MGLGSRHARCCSVVTDSETKLSAKKHRLASVAVTKLQSISIISTEAQTGCTPKRSVTQDIERDTKVLVARGICFKVSAEISALCPVWHYTHTYQNKQNKIHFKQQAHIDF